MQPAVLQGEKPVVRRPTGVVARCRDKELERLRGIAGLLHTWPARRALCGATQAFRLVNPSAGRMIDVLDGPVVALLLSVLLSTDF